MAVTVDSPVTAELLGDIGRAASGARRGPVRRPPTPPDLGFRAMRLAVIAGDGIGPEVVAEGLKVLGEVAPDIESTPYDLGAMRWQRTGELLPDTVVEELRQHDAILLGAIGDPSVPPGILERGLLLRLRFELDHHVNLRPAKLYDGVRSPLADPGQIDMLCVREGTEGPYVGNGGVLRKDTPHEVATEVSLNTAFGVERVVRYAFERAVARPRKHLTLIHKTNVLTHAGGAVVAHGRGGRGRVPRGHRRLPARRRRLDVLHHRPGPLRRDRHRQPVRRHRHRHRRGGHRWHRAGRQRQPRRLGHQPEHVRAGARLGARTSPGRASPTRRPRCCRSGCCWTTSAAPSRRRRSTRRSRSTSPPAPRRARSAPRRRRPARGPRQRLNAVTAGPPAEVRRPARAAPPGR